MKPRATARAALVAGAFALGQGLSAQTCATTWLVCPAGAADSACQFRGNGAIQQAVDRAGDGDTVFVKAGTYTPEAHRDIRFQDLIIRGYVVVRGKHLTIAGEPGTVLDGNGGARTSAFVVEGGNLQFSHLTLRNFDALDPEDDIYDGHGIFAIDSRVTLSHVAIENGRKMGLSIRGDSDVHADHLRIVNGHIGIWLEENARLDLSDSQIEHNESAGLCAYGTSHTSVRRSVFTDNRDDGIYADKAALIEVDDSLIQRNAPYGLRSAERGRITVGRSLVYANAGDRHGAVEAADTVFSGAYHVTDRLPGPDGGYDYVSVDTQAQRVFVARENGVMAVDLAAHTVIPQLIAAPDVSAVLIIPGTPLMLTTNWGGDSVALFDRHSGAMRAVLPAGHHPDGAVFDTRSGLAFAMNGDGSATAVDPQTAAVVAAIPLGGKPEAAVSDGRGRLYINIEDSATVAVLDVDTRKVVKHYALPGCVEPTGIAFDAATGLLISVCHNGTAKLIDAATGADKGSVTIGDNADGAIFDARRRLAFVPCKDGTLTVFRLDGAGRASVVDVVRTRAGARTAALDADSGRLYLPSALPDAEGEPQPGSFQLLTVAAPAAR